MDQYTREELEEAYKLFLQLLVDVKKRSKQGKHMMGLCYTTMCFFTGKIISRYN